MQGSRWILRISVVISPCIVVPMGESLGMSWVKIWMWLQGLTSDSCGIHAWSHVARGRSF